MTRTIGILALLLALAGNVQAGIALTFSGPGSIATGSEATFSAQLTDTGPPTNYVDYSSPIYQDVTYTYSCGFLGMGTCTGTRSEIVGYNTRTFNSESISRIDYSFGSGDGQFFSGSVNGLNAQSYDLSQAFSYAIAGDYTAWFAATVYTADWYDYWAHSYEYVYYTYSCGFFGTGTCSGYRVVDTPYIAQTAQSFTWYAYGTTQLTVADGAALPTAAVPEPETYAMLLAGLGVLGSVVRRRKPKAAGA